MYMRVTECKQARAGVCVSILPYLIVQESSTYSYAYICLKQGCKY